MEENREKIPFVPGIDFSGKVVSSEDAKFKKGEDVILTDIEWRVLLWWVFTICKS